MSMVMLAVIGGILFLGLIVFAAKALASLE